MFIFGLYPVEVFKIILYLYFTQMILIRSTSNHSLLCPVSDRSMGQKLTWEPLPGTKNKATKTSCHPQLPACRAPLHPPSDPLSAPTRGRWKRLFSSKQVPLKDPGLRQLWHHQWARPQPHPSHWPLWIDAERGEWPERRPTSSLFYVSRPRVGEGHVNRHLTEKSGMGTDATQSHSRVIVTCFSGYVSL